MTDWKVDSFTPRRYVYDLNDLRDRHFWVQIPTFLHVSSICLNSSDFMSFPLDFMSFPSIFMSFPSKNA